MLKRQAQSPEQNSTIGLPPQKIWRHRAIHGAKYSCDDTWSVVPEVLRTPGQPLDKATCTFMELCFGHDFSHVRVHTDSNASKSADAVNAIAYTAGQHIVYNRGQYTPATQRGRYVLAHELTHTLQQPSGYTSVTGLVQRIPKDSKDTPFNGEIIPWSAALRESPNHSSRVLVDLPRGHLVSVQGGRWWILVETIVNGVKLTGYVSHELIRMLPGQEAEEATRAPAEPGTRPAVEAVRNPPVTESPNLTQLKELLDKFNVPENDVISLMRILTPGEVATVASSDWFRKAAVAAFDDDEMIDALNAMQLSGERRHQWMKAEGIDVYQILEQEDFKVTVNGVSVNPELLQKAQALCQYLIDNNLVKENIRFSEGARLPITAHKWSTAWNIYHGLISTERLEALPDGKDFDGNLWYKKEWTRSEIAENAKSKMKNRAYEGYPPKDPRRLPNIDDVKQTKHCFGEALDIKIRWRNGDGWHEEAKRLVEQFGLKRPEPDEPWHFELAR